MGHLNQHINCRHDILAVANYFGVEPMIKLSPNTLADALPPGVPTPTDWWLSLAAAKQGMSASGFAGASSATIAPSDDLKLESVRTSQEFQKMLFVYKEVIMDRFRGRIARAIDLSLTCDAKRPVVDWRFVLR